MDIDWDKYMKDHHIKIYTEEELHRKRLIRTVRKAVSFCKAHKEDILDSMAHRHASET